MTWYIGLFFWIQVLGQPEWRFGFEDTWSHLTALMTTAQKQTLLEKLTYLVESQPGHCDINFPALNGGWKGMQPNQGDAIDFKNSDQAVCLLQKYGFRMMWNLRINAPWASAGNPSCYGSGDCAPDDNHVKDLYDFISALIERYDGDGILDMGYETPSDSSDDLILPIQFYLMTGEIEFMGPSPPPPNGKYGDESTLHFWTDSMDQLLKTHRIVYQAIHDADPTGNSRLISSGGVLWDLYSDFPDYPEIEGPTVQSRLLGNNNHSVSYTESFNRLKQILTSFGDDTDGVECDYIGWHPHMPWREIDQTFRFIRKYAGDKPIYVDDMWCNIFPIDHEDAPGNALFTKKALQKEGDFPNALVSSYAALKQGLMQDDPEVVAWYYARHARTLVKAFVSVFGYGAERACISGIADIWEDKLNLMSTMALEFKKKPGYYTYRLMVDLLYDFTEVQELILSSDPKTRVYLFQRPRGEIYVGWSETGAGPPDLDYTIPNGEFISLPVQADQVLQTQIISNLDHLIPETDVLPVSQNSLNIQLGYSPVFLEPISPSSIQSLKMNPFLKRFMPVSVTPNPFNPATTIRYELSEASQVMLNIRNSRGQRVWHMDLGIQEPGAHHIQWQGRCDRDQKLSSGIYILQFNLKNRILHHKMILIQ
ncbi:hypothetical protein JW835_11015 [bacterium]|nr:hypothetical protein [bacterium]